ncbi:hypothetical protein JTB14_028418 [Gonioctena quinquepunctata]|nr:hypothetical protein JTB14_028418 [Gonioctena quinquepunctata]
MVLIKDNNSPSLSWALGGNHLFRKRKFIVEKESPRFGKTGKKYNPIVYGVKKTSENTSEELLKIVKDVLKINCSIHNYRDIFGVGKPSTEKTRPIVAEVLCWDLKSQILNAANLLREDLWKLGVIFSMDYAKEDYIRRKFLYNQLKLAKSTYPEARLKNDQLYLNNGENTILSYDELLEKNGRKQKEKFEKRKFQDSSSNVENTVKSRLRSQSHYH